MDIDVVSLLRELDFSIEEGTSARSRVLRSPDNAIFLMSMVPSVQRVTAHTLRNFIAHRGSPVRPLFIGCTATDSVIEQAREGQVDVLTQQPLQLILKGTVFTPEVEQSTPIQRQAASGRKAWGRWAIERCLLLADTPLHQSEIAEYAGVSQQMVSRVCKDLGSLATHTVDGVETLEPVKLLERWRAHYPGAGGQQFGWYSLDPIVEQTLNAVEEARLLDANPLVSGDVAADRLMPWKLPTRGRIYVDSPVDLAGCGFVPAPLEEATLITCIPEDPTVWRLTWIGAFAIHEDMDLADAVLVYWDVLNSNDIDSHEAAEHLAALITTTLSL
ncbi:hypothetical protein M2368_003562 [Arthrobacter sp. JUb119]|uniref:hypothetical protein n=1 Tax=Arthrobacter sp. JUb115 TaxID=2485108 RepID=UPI00105E7DF2|nr:hypothetical protein [Arthrobacter sp. JUb115]MCS3494530.1 hypothetical protein [Arthrobacter sp. JUb119]TDU22620.1 hypothetical protein EDF61_109150 [Arthrobacter sp. JUb115]